MNTYRVYDYVMVTYHSYQYGEVSPDYRDTKHKLLLSSLYSMSLWYVRLRG
jgi:hypothetical protein